MNEEIKRALEHMATRGADPGAEAVVQRASAAAPKRRRQRRIRQVTAIVAVVAIAGLAAVVGGRSSGPRQVVVAVPTTTTAPASTFFPDPRVTGCFSVPSADASGGVTPSVEQHAGASARLLVLMNDGALWVLDGNRATQWSDASGDARHSPIVWARWLSDGSILAARVGNADVEVDQLSGPERSEVVARLGYTIKAHAPAGSCPIDGYLATFGVVDAGVVLLRHMAGPIRHSCRARAPGSECDSPEGYSIEVRTTQDLATVGTPTGDSAGGAGLGHSEIVSASRASDVLVIDEGAEALMLRVGPHKICCLGGQSGTAYAVSPGGQSVAYAKKPDGRHVNVADIGVDVPAEQPGTPLWNADDQVTALAWSGNAIASVQGSRVAFVSYPAGASLGEARFGGPIRTIDYEHQ